MKDYLKTQIELHKRIAKNYDARYGFAYAQLYQDYWNHSILGMLGNGYQNKHYILELGCGTGSFLKELVQRFRLICGIDVSIDMVQQIDIQSEALKGVIVGDGMTTPFNDSAFDVVLCRGVLHHLPDLTGAFAEIRRVLKSNGLLVFSEPSNDSAVIRLARKIMYRKSDKFSEEDIAFRSRELKRLLKRNGFYVTRVKRFGFLSYVFAGFPDHFAFLSKVPGNVAIVKILVGIDKILSVLPVLNRQSLHIIVAAQKTNH